MSQEVLALVLAAPRILFLYINMCTREFVGPPHMHRTLFAVKYTSRANTINSPNYNIHIIMHHVLISVFIGHRTHTIIDIILA